MKSEKENLNSLLMELNRPADLHRHVAAESSSRKYQQDFFTFVLMDK